MGMRGARYVFIRFSLALEILSHSVSRDPLRSLDMFTVNTLIQDRSCIFISRIFPGLVIERVLY